MFQWILFPQLAVIVFIAWRMEDLKNQVSRFFYALRATTSFKPRSFESGSAPSSSPSPHVGANYMSPHVPIRSMSARFPMIIPRTTLAYAWCMNTPSLLASCPSCCSASSRATSLRGIAQPTINENGAKCRCR